MAKITVRPNKKKDAPPPKGHRTREMDLSEDLNYKITRSVGKPLKMGKFSNVSR
jgi:hypothetical protein